MKAKLGLPLLLMLVFACSRWPGLLPSNFSAAYALAFCAGVYFPARMAWWLPLGTLLVTDFSLNVFYYHVSPFTAYMLGNSVAYLAIVALGRLFNRRSSWFAVLGGGVLGALLFYLVTNTAAWLQNPEYAKTLAGWIQALTIGTPGWPQTWEFFRNTLLSGGLFSGLFAGAMKFSEALEPADEEESAVEPEEGEETAPEESKA